MAYRTTPKMAARKEARRITLLQTATRLFGQHGYHATTVPMIVEASGVSTGSFYTYFRNKEDIFAATLLAMSERLDSVIAEAKAGQIDPAIQIRSAVKALFLFLAQNPREARILIVESSGLSPALEEVRRKILAHRAAEVRQTLEQHPGRFPVRLASVAARCLVGSVLEALYDWLETPAAGRLPAVEVADAVACYNASALAAPGALRKSRRPVTA